MIEKRIKDSSLATPDPERSIKNLTAFLEENPTRKDEFTAFIREISLLFSMSQFLANYSIINPDALFGVLRGLENAPDKDSLSISLRENRDTVKAESHRSAMSFYMKTMREFKIRELLRITLRDILKKADLVDIMLELSDLADVIIEYSLELV
ncbi:MAG: hypothetical protein WAV13_00465, partial [Thermodesulfovibrionales bacterium]